MLPRKAMKNLHPSSVNARKRLDIVDARLDKIDQAISDFAEGFEFLRQHIIEANKRLDAMQRVDLMRNSGAAK